MLKNFNMIDAIFAENLSPSFEAFQEILSQKESLDDYNACLFEIKEALLKYGFELEVTFCSNPIVLLKPVIS